MVEYDYMEIGEVAEVTKLAGFEFTKYIEYIEDGEIIALRALNLRHGELDLSDIKRIDKQVSNSLVRSKLYKNDILLTYTGNGYGDCAIIEENDKYHLAPNICKITPDTEQIDPYFLYCYIRTNEFYQTMSNHMTGSSQPTIPMKTIRVLKVPVPPIEEQKKISSFMRSIDWKIRNNTAINKNLEQQAQAYFDELFVTNADPNWPDCTLSDIGSIVAGGTPSKSKPEYYANQGIAWITPKDLSLDKSKFISRGENDISELGFSKSSATKMPAGAVLFSSRAPIGYIAIAQNEVTTNQGFKSVVPNENIGTAYLYFLLRNLLPIIEGMASGSTFKEISAAGMKSVPTVMPDVDTIRLFNAFCEPIFKEQEILEAENRRLSALRDYLLPKLMSGEIDVSELDI